MSKKSSRKKSIISEKSRLARIHKLVQENFVESIAFTSIMLNIFFIIGIVLYNTSPKFEKKVAKYTYVRYCTGGASEDYDSSDEDEVTFNEVFCKQGDFSQYWSQAVKEYDALKKRQDY